MAPLVPSDIYPAVRRFLSESGLNKTLRALDKEVDGSMPKTKAGRAMAELELIEACQQWLDSHRSSAAAAGEAASTPTGMPNGAAGQDGVKPKKKKQRDIEASVAEPEAVLAAEAGSADAPKKKRKRDKEQLVEEEPAAVEEEKEADAPRGKKKKNKTDGREEKQSGVPFQRIDDEKWRKTLKDDRFIDNSHQAKQKFGTSAGDTWADRAAEDLFQVKGKGFRKEMAKKKRASWRGGGEIDQGVNSVKFEDSDED